MTDREATEARRRQSSMRSALARSGPVPGDCPPSRVVRVVDLGDLPTALPAVFACVDVGISTGEAEGDTPTLSAADDADAFGVLVIGTTAPSDNAYLLATLIDGLWIAHA